MLLQLPLILPAPPGAQDADKAAVVATVLRLLDALETRDSVAGMATFHPSATILVVAGTPPTVTQTTPAALVGSIARSTAGTFKERIFDTEVRIDGDVAQLWAYFTVHIGNVFNRCGTDAMTLVRVDGAWKISHAAFTRRTLGCRHTEPLGGAAGETAVASSSRASPSATPCLGDYPGIGGGRIEYSGSSPRALFARSGNLVSLDFHRMLIEVVRFNREGLRALERPIEATLTLGDFLDRHAFSNALRRHYLLPMAAAIWSGSTGGMLDFPLSSFLRFFANHGLLTVNDQPKWRTVTGGSRVYVDRLAARFRSGIRTSTVTG